jgi:hypothetical protein
MDELLGATDDPFEGGKAFSIYFDLLATVRDMEGQLTQTWIPGAGSATYYAHCTTATPFQRT